MSRCLLRQLAGSANGLWAKSVPRPKASSSAWLRTVSGLEQSFTTTNSHSLGAQFSVSKNRHLVSNLARNRERHAGRINEGPRRYVFAIQTLFCLVYHPLIHLAAGHLRRGKGSWELPSLLHRLTPPATYSPSSINIPAVTTRHCLGLLWISCPENL